MLTIDLPESVEIIDGPFGPRFKGPALPLRRLAESLRVLSKVPLGFVCLVGHLELYVTDDPSDPHAQGRVSMPRNAWNILASKFVEVTAGYEESPFDFGDCGFLYRRPDPDLGVVLVGEPKKD